MSTWYSPSTNGFYQDSFTNLVVIPTDAIQVPDDLYANIVNGMQMGFVITTDDTGNPMVSNTSIYPSNYNVITSLSFINRFTPTERGEVVVAALEALQASPPDPTLTIFLDDLGAATVVYLDDPILINAIAALQAYGLISSDRANTIMQLGAFEESTDAPVQ